MWFLSLLAAIGRVQDSMFIPALLLAGKDLEWPSETIGLLGALFVVGSGVSAIFKGRLLDRLGLRVVSGQVFLSALFFFLIAISLYKNNAHLALLGSLGLGLCRVNSGALMQAVWADRRLPESFSKKGMSWEMFVNTFFQVIGPLLAGGAALFFGYNFAVVLAGILVVLSMSLWSLPLLHLKEDLSEKIKGIFSFNHHQIKIFSLGAILTCLFSLCQFNLISIYPGETPTVLLSLFALGSAIISLWLAKKPKTRNLDSSIILFQIALFLIIGAVFFEKTAILLPFLVLGGGLYTGAMIYLRFYLRDRSKNSDRFSSWGGLVSFSSLGSGIGFILPGIFGTWQTKGGIIISLVLFFLLSIVYFLSKTSD